jgi:16S rRNA (cytosine967-C5)-methyltransferase
MDAADAVILAGARGEDGMSARRMALDLLNAVLIHDRPLDQAFNDHRALLKLREPDRAFARNLAATTLRRLGQIDAALAAILDRSSDRTRPAARNLLRLGACQLLFLNTPPHAAVHTAVAIARSRRPPISPGLINAVLRRVAAEADALRSGQDAALLNTPQWLWRAWSEAYGETSCRAIAQSHLVPPPLDLSAKNDAALLAGRLAAELLPTGTVRLRDPAPVARIEGFENGAWWVQDAAAALPVRLLGDVRGRSVIDLCAAPGGKTAQLAAAGATVTAVDASASRMARLRENLHRLRLTAETVVADAAVWRPKTPPDAVLVDVPCSATGTIRRHPDIPWLKRNEDIARLAPVQDRLLEAAIEMVGPGGLVVYCACSLQPEEGRQRVEARIAAGRRGAATPVERVPIGVHEVGGRAELLSGEGDLRTLPCHLAEHGGLDGFYAARLMRPRS